MRIFLIIISFINALIYILFYAYYDNILEILGTSFMSSGFQSFVQIMFLFIIGFCIGIIALLFLNLRGERSYFDIRNLILLGIIPFLMLFLSMSPISNFITSNLFSQNTQMQELVFYMLSRQTLWALWLGFSLGTSIRPCFSRNVIRHMKKDPEGGVNGAGM